MILKNRFKRYPIYKDSGVEWLGEIPEGWKINKLKYFGYIFAGIGGKKGDDFSKEAKVSFKQFIPFINICNNHIISTTNYQYVKIIDNEKQNKIQKNDILFLMSSETLSDIAKCSLYQGNDEELYLNSFCKGFRIVNTKLKPKYINYLYSSSAYRNYFSLVGRGFTRINLKQEFINDSYVIVPKKTEQTTITNFLDKKTTKIDNVIAQKKKLIALLKERKQIVIQNAVTKGLNPNAKMKDSGVEWIGEISAGWEVVANKVLFSERNENGDESLPILSVSIHSAVSSEELRDDENIRGKIKIQDKSHYKRVEVNDIVFNMMRAWQGAIGVVKIRGMVSPAYIVSKPLKNQINSTYFEYLYRTSIYIHQMNRVSKGITDFRKRLYWDEFKQITTLLPSNIEQKQIVQHIQTQSCKIDKAINLQEKQIEKLKEYKAILIDNAVTGKIKVC